MLTTVSQLWILGAMDLIVMEGFFSNSLLGQRLAGNQLTLPVPIDLPGTSLLGKVKSRFFLHSTQSTLIIGPKV